MTSQAGSDKVSDAAEILRTANVELVSALKVARHWIERAYLSVVSFGEEVSGPARDTLDQIDLAITLGEERCGAADRAIALAEHSS